MMASFDTSTLHECGGYVLSSELTIVGSELRSGTGMMFEKVFLQLFRLTLAV